MDIIDIYSAVLTWSTKINMFTVMAIQRIPGQLLQANLQRSGVDLAFETNLLYIDVGNSRIGIGTDSPGAYKLDVAGTARFQNDVLVTGDLTVTGSTTTVDSKNLTVEDNILTLNSGSSTANSAGILINRGAAGNPAVLYWDESTDKFKLVTTTSDGSTTSTITDSAYAKLAGADPTAADDFVTKRYFEANAAGGGVVGTSVTVGTPTDSSFGDGALVGLGDASSVTDALDDLNETMENIRNNTYVKSVDFTADQTTGSAGLTVTLTITTVGGGANRYNITWGDGDTTSATTDSTPSHTYSTNSGSPFDVQYEHIIVLPQQTHLDHSQKKLELISSQSLRHNRYQISSCTRRHQEDHLSLLLIMAQQFI